MKINAADEFFNELRKSVESADVPYYQRAFVEHITNAVASALKASPYVIVRRQELLDIGFNPDLPPQKEVKWK